MVFSPLLIAALLPLAAQAANDWNKPCFGQCNWDINTGKGSGTVQLVSGSPSLSCFNRRPLIWYKRDAVHR